MILADFGTVSTAVVSIVGVISIVGSLWRAIHLLVQAVNTQVTVTKNNTMAIEQIDKRLEKLEQAALAIAKLDAS